MYHTSAKLTFGGGEKNIWGTESSRGRQRASGAPKRSRGRKKPIRKTEKIVVTFFFSFFFFFLGDSKKFVLCRGAKNFSRGRQ